MESKLPPPLLPHTFEKLVAPWLIGIRRRELTSVMSYPSSDRQRRIINLEDDELLQRRYLGGQKYLWINVDFRIDPLDLPADLEARIVQILKLKLPGLIPGPTFSDTVKLIERKYRTRLILTAMGAEKLIQERNIPILTWFSAIYRREILSLLLFFETNLLAAQAIKLFKFVPTFQPHIHAHALYSRPDAAQWIERMCAEWEMKLISKVKIEILDICGSNFLFIKSVLWYLRDHPRASAAEATQTTEMQFNLELQWQGFSPDERQVLDLIILKQPLNQEVPQAALKYLELTGFIEKQTATYRLTVPILEKFRLQALNQNVLLKLNGNREITLNGVAVDTHFSRRQRRVLVYFLEHPGIIISRDTVGGCIWGDMVAEKYSDWAIDSLISRLKLHLRQLGIAGSVLETKKGKGFIFHYK